MNSPQEEWRPVVGWEGWYEVSNLGRLRRVAAFRATPPGRTLRGRLQRGYRFVYLHGPGGPEHQYIHRLVLHAFVGPAPEGHQAAHLDGRRDNNRLDNLMWKSPRENEGDKRRHGTAPIGERNGWARLRDRDIPVIRHLVADGMTMTQVGREYGVSHSTISLIVRGKIWKHVA